ncbi:PucR family transcriptional regulator [Kribbella solani]|uniref:Sugar diacid utilization regulator n=1 Tax=Kribbella solani TaxID=236067 RepID=A0A841DTJ9_9ACTN|nr:helix-turn-helix domain-containing protein [Kribbella solani]MBB5980050.1 sugar diacid utilization regulator [Kribbella solani]
MPQLLTHDVAGLLDRQSRLQLTLLAGPGQSRSIRRASGVRTLRDLDQARPGSIAVVLEPLGTDVGGYAMDVAIRQADQLGLAAIVLDSPYELSLTARHLAGRAKLPVIGSSATRAGAEILLRVDRFLRGGAAEVLARADAAIRAARDATASGTPDPIGAVLDAASASLGCRLNLIEHAPDDPLAPGAVVLGEQAVAEVTCAPRDEATEVVLPAVAALVSRMRQRELNQRFAPSMTRAELILRIVLSEHAQLPQLTDQAYRIGLQIQYTHVATWLRVDPVPNGSGEPAGPVERRRLLGDLELSVLQSLHAKPGTWHVLSLDGALLVLRSEPDPGAGFCRQVHAEMSGLVTGLADRDDVTVTAGLGTARPGADGIRQSTAEAQVTADGAAAAGRRGTVNDTDPSGLRRILTELYAAPLTRNLLAELLAPLDALGPERSRTAIHTLSAYFDAQGSPKQTARKLHLHPNAVSYRLRWIAEALGTDLGDADTRFALQLACRLRLLASTPDSLPGCHRR